MPASRVQIRAPLIRTPTISPGQYGVPGTDHRTGLRQHTTGAIFYVDPNAAGVSDQRDGTNPDAPLATIAAAVDLCQPYRGDQIRVMANGAWQYAYPFSGYNTGIVETVTLDVPGVSLVGVFPSSMPGVPWSPTASLDTCLTITAMDCSVEGFAFTSGAHAGANGIYAEWDGITLFADNVTIRHCLFDGDIDIAIQLEFAWYTEVSECFFEQCDTAGIYIDAAGSGCAYCLFHDNWFQDCATAAMSLAGLDDSFVEHNRIYNAAAQGGGAATDTMIFTTGGSSNIVSQNVLSCILPAAAPGDYDDSNTASATDAWISNFCMNGPSATNPT